jgi:hypothetical protein
LRKEETTETPSGRVRRRLSPSGSSLKLVWSGWPGVRRFLEEAKTMRWPPGGMMVGEGKRQRVGLAGRSLRNQPPRLREAGPGLAISIQSGESESSSSRPPRWAARNSDRLGVVEGREGSMVRDHWVGENGRLAASVMAWGGDHEKLTVPAGGWGKAKR